MGLNKESRTKNAGRNAVSALLNKTSILVLTLIGRRVFIHYIGVEYLGINGLFANILTLLAMADFGLGTAMNVSLYKPIAENDTKKLSALLNYFRVIYYTIAATVFILGIGLIPVLPYIVNLESDIPNLYLFYIIYVIKTAVSYLFVYKASIINADQKGYLINSVDIIVNFAKVVIQIVSILFFRSYLVYLIIDVLAVLGHNLAVSTIANRQYAFLEKEVRLAREDRNYIFKDIYSAFLYRIGGSILGGTDNILISVLVGTIAVGLYSNYLTITTNLETFVALLFGALTASVGNLVATSSAPKRYSTYKTMQMIANWISAVFSICLFFLTQDFILIWLHDKSLLLDNYVIISIVINMFYTLCMRPIWTFREGTGMYRQIRYVMLITAGINIVLSIILGKWIGVGGILIATTISKFIACFWYEPYLLFKNFFNIEPQKYYISYFGNLVLTIICGAACLLPMRLFHDVNVFNWIIKGLICVIIVTVIYFVRYHRTVEFSYIKGKMQILIRRFRCFNRKGLS